MVGVPQEAGRHRRSTRSTTICTAAASREGRRVRFLYVVPNFQNPTGLLIGLDKRQALLEWAARRDVLIVEDDPYRELYFEDSATEADVRPIKADDDEGRVIYLSSFSKTLAPGFRVAWIDAPAPIAAKLEMAKQAADLCTGSLDQRIVYEACRRGILERQLPLLRAHYQHKRDVMVEALQRDVRRPTVVADAARRILPVGDAARPASMPIGCWPRAVEHGVIYVAGEAFFVERQRAEPDAAVVLGADAGADPRRRAAAGGGGRDGARGRVTGGGGRIGTTIARQRRERLRSRIDGHQRAAVRSEIDPLVRRGRR